MREKLVKAIDERYGSIENLIDAMRECQDTVYVNLAHDIDEGIYEVEKAIEKVILYHEDNYYNKKPKQMKKLMNKKEFIDKHVLPNESKETIIGYLQGEVDFDEDYLQEIADKHKVIINEATPTWIGVEIPTSWGYYKICIGLNREDGNEVSYFSEADLEHFETLSEEDKKGGPWIYDGDVVVRYGEDARVFDDNHNLLED
tara:strand:- start:1159 stop:1761 length:603 start_codon:yes stop_codon:yes gene_type:complete